MDPITTATYCWTPHRTFSSTPFPFDRSGARHLRVHLRLGQLLRGCLFEPLGLLLDLGILFLLLDFIFSSLGFLIARPLPLCPVLEEWDTFPFMATYNIRRSTYYWRSYSSSKHLRTLPLCQSSNCAFKPLHPFTIFGPHLLTLGNLHCRQCRPSCKPRPYPDGPSPSTQEDMHWL